MIMCDGLVCVCMCVLLYSRALGACVYVHVCMCVHVFVLEKIGLNLLHGLFHAGDSKDTEAIAHVMVVLRRNLDLFQLLPC